MPIVTRPLPTIHAAAFLHFATPLLHLRAPKMAVQNRAETALRLPQALIRAPIRPDRNNRREIGSRNEDEGREETRARKRSICREAQAGAHSSAPGLGRADTNLGPSPPARRPSGWQRDPARRIMPYAPPFSSHVHPFLK